MVSNWFGRLINLRFSLAKHTTSSITACWSSCSGQAEIAIINNWGQQNIGVAIGPTQGTFFFTACHTGIGAAACPPKGWSWWRTCLGARYSWSYVTMEQVIYVTNHSVYRLMNWSILVWTIFLVSNHMIITLVLCLATKVWVAGIISRTMWTRVVGRKKKRT